MQGEESFFLLGGYAGTGKSSIIFAFIRELLSKGKRIALSAPTNKAVSVLRKMACQNNLYVNCLTIHQLLGLAVVNRGSEKILEQVKPSSIHLYDLVFLDECSMVGEQLWQCLQENFVSNILTNRKLILMGDPAQLNPVREKRSHTFKVKNRFVLTEVVRQAGDSPLLDFVTATRAAIDNKTEIFIPKSCHRTKDKSNGAFKVTETGLLKLAIAKIEREFASNPDCFRLLCYTNKRVSYYNCCIHEALYGKDAPLFIPGERLIAKKPVIAPDGTTVILPVSSEVNITEVSETRYYGYLVFLIKVTSDEGDTKQIFVLHPVEQARYNAELQQKYESAKRNPFLWRKYYQFRDEVFAEVTNCFALTVHNSQGNTFIEGAIDGKDLYTRLFVGEESRRQKLREYHRLWYVAASRMQHRVFFSSTRSSQILNRVPMANALFSGNYNTPTIMPESLTKSRQTNTSSDRLRKAKTTTNKSKDSQQSSSHSNLEVTCDVTLLNNCLDFVSKGIPSNPIHPILSNVLLCADREHQLLHLTTNNLEFGMTTSFKAKVHAAEKIALPMVAFQQIARKFPPTEVNIDCQIDRANTEESSAITSVQDKK